MTTVAFRPLSEAEQIFKSVIWDPMLLAGEIWLEATVPFLDLPVIKQIDESLIGDLTDAVFNYIVLIVDVEAIKLVNAARQSAYDTASLKLKVIAQNEGVNSDAYAKARDAAIAAQVKLTDIAAGQSG